MYVVIYIKPGIPLDVRFIFCSLSFIEHEILILSYYCINIVILSFSLISLQIFGENISDVHSDNHNWSL